MAALPRARAIPRAYTRRSAGGFLIGKGLDKIVICVAAANAEADRLDPGWRISDLNIQRAEVPPDSNPAEHLTRAALDLPEGWPDESTDALLDRLARLDPAASLPPSLADDLLREAARIAPAAEKARTLAESGRGRFDVICKENFLETALPHLQDADSIGLAMRLDAESRLLKGDVDDALEAAGAILGCVRAIGDEPMSSSQNQRMRLIREAIGLVARVLASGEASDAALLALQGQLSAMASEPILLLALRADRAQFDDLMAKLADGRVSLDDDAAPPGTVERTMVSYNRGRLLHAFNQAVEIARHPEDEQIPLWNAWITALEEPTDPITARLSAYSTMLLLTTESLPRHWFRTRASIAGAIGAIAAERYRLANGSWPEDAGALEPFSPGGSVPIDPFTTEPILLGRLDDGLVVYSTGPDQEDDDGGVPRTAARPLRL